MKLIALSVAAVATALILATPINASTKLERTTAAQHYAHANGYIKAIGKNARRTIYHPNPAIKHRWQAALHFLMRVRERAWKVLHPPALWPPHHALWMCIHGHEGNWNDPNSGGNGHYGGLQMHPGWGYGTSYYANNDSQFVQEWAAERGFIASGYSRSWLLGQWYHPDCAALA